MKTSSSTPSPISGLLWSFYERFLGRGLEAFFVIILAWFLVPGSYSSMAVVSICLAFARVFVEGGLDQALIRKSELSEDDLSTALFCSIGLAALMYTLFWFAAPVIAQFYGKPDLLGLIRVGMLTCFAAGLVPVQRCQLSRKLDFRKQARITVPATAIAGAFALVMAYLGMGAWSLVAQVFVQSLASAMLFWIFVGWRPKTFFSYSSFREIMGFSVYLIFAAAINVPFRQMYLIVITKVFPETLSGLFFFAQKVKNLIIEQTVGSIQTVTYPLLSRYQIEQQDLKHRYRTILKLMGFVMAPVIIIAAAMCNTFVSLLLPPAWSGSSDILQLMLIASMLYPLHTINVNLLKVKGRADLVFKIGILKSAVALVIFVFTVRHGITAIIMGQLLAAFIALIPNTYFSHRLIGYSLMEQIRDYFPYFILAAIVAAPIVWYMSGSATMRLVSALTTTLLIAGLYLLLSHILHLPGLRLAITVINRRSALTAKAS